MRILIYFITTITMLTHCTSSKLDTVLYSSDSFTIYSDKVVQGKNVAKVISPTHIRSNYKSPASSSFSNLIKFKFAINEKDNELPIGDDHWIYIDGENQSPIIKFGNKPAPFEEKQIKYLPTNYVYTFRLDVSEVMRQFAEKGYFTTYNGDKIAQSDFKGIYIAGNADPLSWDFVNLRNKGLQLQPTDNPDIYSITVLLNPYNEADHQDKEWQLSLDVSHKPRYTSDQPLVDAMYNLSLEEALKNIEPDSTLRTGAKWGGVWTRDVSYSILLAFAYHEPEVAKISLRKKVKRGRIIQDTGSGGAWPVSSDRTTWCLAAWEIYKVTGDRDWLDEVYPIIKTTLEDDYKTIYDADTGMYRGESSFLDWREQTYPKWIDNKDIYSSLNLGTNVVHYQAHKILNEMDKIKGEDGQIYLDRANTIKKGINDHLWLRDKGYYAQFTYGRGEQIVSPRYEALGEALAILFDVADGEQATSIISRSPLTEYGATCIYPQIPDIPPYHNNGIWPFVQSYWNWAAAKNGNEEVLLHGLASVYRAAALFLSNYENMVAETGDFLGTEINSDRMLWSMAGNLAMVHRIFMGMDYKIDGLHFTPIIPKAYSGNKNLSNFRYRNAKLDMTINGHGTQIKSVFINDKEVDKAYIPHDAQGLFKIVINMANNHFPNKGINKVRNKFSFPTVMASVNNKTLEWKNIENVSKYKIYQNGQLLKTIQETSYSIPDNKNAFYMVSAVDNAGNESFASEPILVTDYAQDVQLEDFAAISALPYSNYSSRGFVEINNHKNNGIQMTMVIPSDGEYLLDFRYSNGSGPWNTDNKCAIRSVYINDKYTGVAIFPQRGQDEWSNWGYSNGIKVKLNKGKNNLHMQFDDWNNNMNLDINRAMLDYLRIRKL